MNPNQQQNQQQENIDPSGGPRSSYMGGRETYKDGPISRGSGNKAISPQSLLKQQESKY